MALLAWWSAPEAKLITKFNKNYTQSHFVHMLQTLPVSSNSEVLIMFPEEFDINSCIIVNFKDLSTQKVEVSNLSI